MPDSETQSRSAPTILALIAVFVLPIVVAWWMAVARPTVNEDKLVNHGTLIRPPIDIAASPRTRPLEVIPLTPGEWAVVYVGAGGCDAVCDETLNKLTTIRSVLGQGTTRVRVAALLDEPATAMPGIVALDDRKARAAVSAALGARLTKDRGHAIVFLDWRGQIMMAFGVDAPPGDIKQDLDRLLRASKIK